MCHFPPNQCDEKVTHNVCPTQPSSVGVQLPLAFETYLHCDGSLMQHTCANLRDEDASQLIVGAHTHLCNRLS